MNLHLTFKERVWASELPRDNIIAEDKWIQHMYSQWWNIGWNMYEDKMPINLMDIAPVKKWSEEPI